MQIAIVDDLAQERKALHERLTKQLARTFLQADIYEYESGEDFLAAAKKKTFNILFLDIYMDGMNGIETAEQFRSIDQECLLVFTTTSTDHALDGFRVRAMHYLVKPYTEEDVALLIDELLRRLPKADRYIDIKVNGLDVRLSYKDIVYAEHFSHQIQIKTTNGKDLITRHTFGNFTEPLLTDERFFICNRGVIINMDHVSDFDGISFTMNDGQIINVSRNLLKSARQTFMDYLFTRGNS